MEGASGSSFGIDTILSGAGSSSPGMMNGDFRPLGEARTTDFRSQATPSPCSEIDTVGTAPSSPISVTLEPPEPHLVTDGPQLHHHLHHGQQPPPPPPPPAAAPAQSLQASPQQQPPPPPQPQSAAQQLGSAASAPRTSTSSFLIKDILGDSKPLAACAPYSTSVSPHHTPKQESNAAHESFRPKLEQEDPKTKLDKREDSQSDIKCHGSSSRKAAREEPGPRSAAPKPLRPGCCEDSRGTGLCGPSCFGRGRARGLGGCEPGENKHSGGGCSAGRAARGRGSAALLPPRVLTTLRGPETVDGSPREEDGVVATARLNLICKNRAVVLGAARGRGWPRATPAGRAGRTRRWRLGAGSLCLPGLPAVWQSVSSCVGDRGDR
ncbi:barH-like 2 homeobox protein [Peromyscus californicus insignis]|uniref:barH-like 2 homeobox protein n=1 Tax=Peromyscus californicus insignis TaxID=564181 RepID=UPI0022A778B6|nr:barH-like 2 homeobox protein [Peromyscus californicus insignis]